MISNRHAVLTKKLIKLKLMHMAMDAYNKLVIAYSSF